LREAVISHSIPHVDLVARLKKTEAILDVLERQEADAIMSSDGLMFVRSKDLLERERQAKQVLEEIVAQRTNQLQQVNDRLEEDIVARKQAEQALRVSEFALHELTRHLQQVREDERKRIARDIHDDLGQNLMVLRFDVARMASSPNSVAINQEQVAAALCQIDTTIKAVRAIINDLRPAALDLGLHAALEWQTTEFAQRTGIACQLQIDHDEFALDDQCATALFRIVQEALSNIVRHAKASRVQIIMERTEGQLLLKITDDGIGLAAGSLKKANAFGLLGIEERVDSLGGSFSIVSHPCQGVAILLSIPL
jgi:signal transduction histidine kinase